MQFQKVARFQQQMIKNNPIAIENELIILFIYIKV